MVDEESRVVVEEVDVAKEGKREKLAARGRKNGTFCEIYEGRGGGRWRGGRRGWRESRGGWREGKMRWVGAFVKMV